MAFSPLLLPSTGIVPHVRVRSGGRGIERKALQEIARDSQSIVSRCPEIGDGLKVIRQRPNGIVDGLRVQVRAEQSLLARDGPAWRCRHAAETHARRANLAGR